MNAKEIVRGLLGAWMLGAPVTGYAQATRTWVSGTGNDTNPCSRTAPCQTFAGAISKTAASGEINVLDPGGFGALTITKAITIRSDHIEAGVLVSGTNGITINAGTGDTVVLEGLDIQGEQTGLAGVSIAQAARVYIIRCSIQNFMGNGVDMLDGVAASRVFIKDSFISSNNGGVNVQGVGVANLASVINTVIDSNASFAVQASGTGNVIGVSNSVFTASPIAINLLNGAIAVSFGPSNLVSGPGTFTSTNPFK